MLSAGSHKTPALVTLIPRVFPWLAKQNTDGKSQAIACIMIFIKFVSNINK
jgi:hypothetical protein